MRPTLEPGSRILVQKHGYGYLSTFGVNFGRLTPTATLRRGEIVVFDALEFDASLRWTDENSGVKVGDARKPGKRSWCRSISSCSASCG